MIYKETPLPNIPGNGIFSLKSRNMIQDRLGIVFLSHLKSVRDPVQSRRILSHIVRLHYLQCTMPER